MLSSFKVIRSQLFEINCFAIFVYLIFYIVYPLMEGGLYKIYSLINAKPMSFANFSNQYGDLVMIGLVSIQIVSAIVYQHVKKIKFEPFDLKENVSVTFLFVSFLCVLSFNFLSGFFSIGLEGVINQVGYTLMPSEVDLPKLNAVGQFFSVVYTVIAGPVAEEVVYRGVIARQAMRLSPAFGIILSSLIFSGMHANLDQTVPTFMIGLFLGLIYYSTGSLMLPICLHILNNLAVTLMNYWPIEQWLPSLPGVWSVFSELMFYLFFLIVGLITLSRVYDYLVRDYQLKWSKLFELNPFYQFKTSKNTPLISHLLVYCTLITTYLLFGLYWIDTLASLTPLK